jgi:hypothetical protein
LVDLRHADESVTKPVVHRADDRRRTDLRAQIGATPAPLSLARRRIPQPSRAPDRRYRVDFPVRWLWRRQPGPLQARRSTRSLRRRIFVVSATAHGRDIAARANKPILAARLTPDNRADAMRRVVVAFAGIAAREILQLLRRPALKSRRGLIADHRRFTQRDYATLSKLRQERGARPATTGKDAARMGGQFATPGVDTPPVTRFR